LLKECIYNNIYIGFIYKDDKIPSKRKKDTTDFDTVNRVLRFLHDFCILQYIDMPIECYICNINLKSNIYVYYDENNTRYIFPEYYFHYIAKHDNIIDERLLTLVDKVILKLY